MLWAVMLLAWLVAGALSPSAQTARPPSDKEVLARAGAHVRRYAGDLPQIVGEETATQRLTPRMRPGAIDERRLVSDVAWVRLDGVDEALCIREVTSVDGQPVDGGRLMALLRSGRGTVDEARALLDESARHNLAPGSRNFNVPTFAFFLLDPALQPRFSWRRAGSQTSPVREFRYRERSRPTVVRTELNGMAPARGRVWIDAATGAVLRTELEVTIALVEYRMEVDFTPVADLGLVLPAALRERYRTPATDVNGSATYQRYRRFQTGARLVP